jgi:hypothetical protein
VNKTAAPPPVLDIPATGADAERESVTPPPEAGNPNAAPKKAPQKSGGEAK